MSYSDRRRWIGLLLLCMVQFMVVLDIAVVNVALPSIQVDLGFSQENLQWVISAYALVFGGFLLDGAAARRWPLLASCGTRFDAVEERVLRIVVGGFFLLLWDKGAVVPWEQGSRALLTPELDVAHPWIGTVQVLVGLAVTTRATCVVAALGIASLVLAGRRREGSER